MKKPNRNNIGNAGEYYVAHILSSRNYITTITLGRAEKYDILAVAPNKKTIKIQVKTLFDKGWAFRMTKKDEKGGGKNFFYVFVRLNKLEKEPEYWVFPSLLVNKIIREIHKKYSGSRNKSGKKPKKTDIRAFVVRDHRLYPKKWGYVCSKKYYKNYSIF